MENLSIENLSIEKLDTILKFIDYAINVDHVNRYGDSGALLYLVEKRRDVMSIIDKKMVAGKNDTTN